MLLTVLGGVLLLTYPVLIYFGLSTFEPRWLVLLIPFALAGGVLRGGQASPLRAAGAWLAVPLVVFLAFTLMTNDERVLRLYPAIINASLAAAFAGSLWSSETLIERLARITSPDLPAEGAAYCRKVTRIWAAFMTLNTLIAAWTALHASRETWALYNGLVSYILMGVLFGIEYIVRQRVKRRVHGPVAVRP